ncbi:MAG: NUDIX domain-containing protein [Candidatus Izemoplasmatales bacterium]|jgi:8-oxo-dGTP diphosphatase|nr:NUDIX domain-containing protein [Candidatus Izemoplasmatales bacterium]
MKLFNLILVLNKTEDKVLMCYRSKNPYKGKYNLVGGKIEKDEDYLSSAYRELFEETGINNNDIKLIPFMEFSWEIIDMKMFVFIGRLDKDILLIEEAHKLIWMDINENFFNLEKYAGEGNIGHMIEIYKFHRDKIFKD